MKASIVLIAIGIFMAEANNVSNVPTITLGVRFVSDTTFIKARQEKNHTTPLTKYLEMFLCAVELYLRYSTCPKIKLFLTGSYNTSKEQESIFERTDTELGVPKLDPTLTLGLFEEWVKNMSEFSSDDIVFLITRILIDDHIGGGIAKDKGYSYFNGLCHLGVGLVHDTGTSFDGVIPAAQQIAHMLGSPWDITDACPESNKTLMATRFGPLGISECTKQALITKYEDILSSPVCLKNSSKHGSCNAKLPAAYFQKENFCATRHPSRVVMCPEGNRNYVNNKTECKIGCCKENTTESSGFRYVVPDGTGCEDGKICIFGVCSQVAMEDNV